MSRLTQFFRLGVTVEPETAAGRDSIQLAAGRVSKVECGRSGQFTAMGGKIVKFTPDTLKGIAESFTGPKKIKVSHDPITTATPNYGEIVGLAYDEKRDRLIASTKPNEYLAELNRKGAFERVSMELVPKGDSYALEALSFLGAHDPAITDLEPVAFAAGEERVILCCAEEVEEDDPDVIALALTVAERKKIAPEDFARPPDGYPCDTQAHLDAAATLIGKAPADEQAAIKTRAIRIAKRKGLTLPKSWQDETVSAAAGGDDMELTEEQKTRLARADALEAENKRLKGDREGYAKSRVKLFLASDNATKKIPLPALKNANLERFLVALAMLDQPAAKVMLAAADGKSEAESTLYEAAEQIFLGFPDKIARQDEIAGGDRAAGEGDQGELPANVARFDFRNRTVGDGVQFAKSEIHEKTLAFMAAEEKAGRKTTYTAAVEAVSRAQRKSG